MKIAFYKGRKRLFNRFISFWTRGPYSHCEAVFDHSPDASRPSMCASSSFMDGGVRFKSILLDPECWDVIEVPGIDQGAARQWFDRRVDAGYDVIGLLSTSTPVPDCKRRYFCSEALGSACGLQEAWRFSPNTFARVCELLGGRWIQGGPVLQEQKAAGVVHAAGGAWVRP